MYVKTPTAMRIATITIAKITPTGAPTCAPLKMRKNQVNNCSKSSQLNKCVMGYVKVGSQFGYMLHSAERAI